MEKGKEPTIMIGIGGTGVKAMDVLKKKIKEEMEGCKHNMERFIEAQNKDYEGYEMALEEMRQGKKQSHWIWYIFPQLVGLGKSGPATYYGIKDLEEAREYIEHPILGQRLIEISEVLLTLEENRAEVVMDTHIDAVKLRSSMTLFSIAAPECEVFEKVLDKFFHGRKDWNTIKKLEMK